MENKDEEYLRDLFAMFTLNGIATRGISSEEYLNQIAENCYKMADAMLRVRNKNSPNSGITAVNLKQEK